MNMKAGFGLSKDRRLAALAALEGSGSVPPTLELSFPWVIVTFPDQFFSASPSDGQEEDEG